MNITISTTFSSKGLWRNWLDLLGVDCKGEGKSSSKIEKYSPLLFRASNGARVIGGVRVCLRVSRVIDLTGTRFITLYGLAAAVTGVGRVYWGLLG